ncbi:hypothetical protein [Methylophaga sp. OBS3]|uniref:hypothetical protein n=1 Tax=Methylophaga sp. OBS3 TaxID=2991934 RepID=UPI00225C1FC2|nr:hypothetical protein [Methylophaga sp. OBS3]MCX4189228.1 hypothetical protein [Methylophaga sp. OBS3]
MTEAAKPGIDLYSIDKLMHETRQLAARYRQTTGTTLPVTGEIARFDAAKALNLTLLDDASLTYDAIGNDDREGQRIVIKGRALFDESRSSTPRIGQINPQQEWDRVVVVFFDDNYQPIDIYEATREEIEEALAGKESKNKKRGAMSVAQFKIIGQLVWTAEQGVESEVWDNQAS